MGPLRKNIRLTVDRRKKGCSQDSSAAKRSVKSAALSWNTKKVLDHIIVQTARNIDGDQIEIEKDIK